MIHTLVPSSENCLTLDVYTPPVSAGTNLPVMVYIYGGAYELGAAKAYNPTPLVTQGKVIVVELNYRLGPIGFLSLPGLAKESPTGSAGNYGLEDQQAGLRWVQRNVAAFGGNANNVTIFGESAGGNSVCNQVVSPTAKGLFQRAISQSGFCSGEAIIPTTTKQEGYAKSAAYARSLGCTDAATMVNCLRGKSQQQLLSSPTVEFTSLQGYWNPTLDGTVLPRAAFDAFAHGVDNHIPMIIGSNRNEARLLISLFYRIVKFRAPTVADYLALVSAQAPGYEAAVQRLYPIAKYGTPEKAMSAFADDQLACTVGASVTAARTGGRILYQYELTDPNLPLAHVNPFMDLGDFHFADTFFLFSKVQGIPVRFLLDPAHLALSAQMIGYWSRFAATGDPNGPGAPPWPVSKARTGQLLALSSTGSSVQSGFNEEHQCAFWNLVAAT